VSADDARSPLHRNEDGSIPVLTLDRGLINLVCPSWCVSGHRYVTAPDSSEIAHAGEPVWVVADTARYGECGLLQVGLSQFPFSDDPEDAEIALVVEGDALFELDPPDTRKVAEALRRGADVIDGLADRLEALRRETGDGNA